MHRKNNNELFYFHLDMQGSLMAISNMAGAVVEERNYDAWGRPRNPTTLAYTLPNPFGGATSNYTLRGYTFHEHLDMFDLINMNGRMYDTHLGIFLNADPLLQDPTNIQNYNRNSYVLNNPLKYTDPTGYASSNPNPYGISDRQQAEEGQRQMASQSMLMEDAIERQMNRARTCEDFFMSLGGSATSLQEPGGPGPEKPAKSGTGKPEVQSTYWNNTCQFLYATPVVGPALTSGYYLGKGDYGMAVGYFGVALGEMFTLGYSSQYRLSSTSVRLAYNGGYKAMATKGVSVIGPRSTYREYAKKIGANFLDVTDEAWTMRKNVEFLQGVVRRGDDVLFSGKFNQLKLDPNSILAQEIQYLTRHGYAWVDDFSRMIKK